MPKIAEPNIIGGDDDDDDDGDDDDGDDADDGASQFRLAAAGRVCTLMTFDALYPFVAFADLQVSVLAIVGAEAAWSLTASPISIARPEQFVELRIRRTLKAPNANNAIMEVMAMLIDTSPNCCFCSIVSKYCRFCNWSSCSSETLTCLSICNVLIN